MKVTVKMSGLLARHLSGSEAGTELELAAGTTVKGLMTRIGVPTGENCLVIVNDAAVPKDRRPDHELSDGDRVSIVPPLKGG